MIGLLSSVLPAATSAALSRQDQEEKGVHDKVVVYERVGGLFLTVVVRNLFQLCLTLGTEVELNKREGSVSSLSQAAHSFRVLASDSRSLVWVG